MSSQNEPKVILPRECSGLELVKGVNPLQAKTTVFGTFHDDAPCESSVARCARRLTASTPRDQVVALVEQVPRDMDTNCLAESPDLGLHTFTDDCRGWNAPGLARQNLYTKNVAVSRLISFMQDVVEPYFQQPHSKGIPTKELTTKTLKILNEKITASSLVLGNFAIHK